MLRTTEKIVEQFKELEKVTPTNTRSEKMTRVQGLYVGVCKYEIGGLVALLAFIFFGGLGWLINLASKLAIASSLGGALGSFIVVVVTVFLLVLPVKHCITLLQVYTLVAKGEL